ncbi:MAG: hypothetical protein Q8P52_02550, partial [bacterium]|nr:hypothetical protein [bacterium]
TDGAMFCQQTKPRVGVAKFPSVGEEIFVTSTHQPRTKGRREAKASFCLSNYITNFRKFMEVGQLDDS